MECCRRRELGLGSLALVPLAEAREKASANRKLARQGGDPLAEKRRTQGIPTFAEATACVLDQKRAGWRVRQRLRAVLEWAVAMEYRNDNPCDWIGPVLGPQHDVVEHMQALPHREVPAAIRTVQASTALPAVRLAFEFLVLTAARWGEVRWAEWAEIDRDGCVWTVPARRAKTNPRHRVPLCGRALEILEAAQALEAGTGPLVFTHGVGGHCMTARCAACCASLGLRRCRTDSAPASGTGQPKRRIIPGGDRGGPGACGRNRVEAAYARSDLFDRQRVLMDDWAR